MESRAKADAQTMAKQITGGILASCFAFAIANSLVSVLINDIIDTFSLSGTAQGLVSSLLSLGMFIAVLVTPLLQGRVRKLTMLLLSGLLQAAALALSGLAQSFELFGLTVALLGVGCGWMDNFSNSCIVDVHSGESPRYLGWLHGIFGVGSLLAPALVAWLMKGTTWRGVYLVTAGYMLLTMAYMLTVCGSVRRGGGIPAIAEKRLAARDMLDYLRSGRNWLLLLSGATSTLMQAALLAWIVRYMTVEFDAAALGATCLTVYWVATTVNRFVVPRMRGRPVALLVWGGVLTAAVFVAGVLVHSPLAMCVTVGLAGLASGHFMPVTVAVCAEDYAGNTTMTTSVLMLVMGVARVAAPLLMAAATDRISADASMLIPAAAALLAGLLCVPVLRDDRRR